MFIKLKILQRFRYSEDVVTYSSCGMIDIKLRKYRRLPDSWHNICSKNSDLPPKFCWKLPNYNEVQRGSCDCTDFAIAAIRLTYVCKHNNWFEATSSVCDPKAMKLFSYKCRLLVIDFLNILSLERCKNKFNK